MVDTSWTRRCVQGNVRLKGARRKHRRVGRCIVDNNAADRQNCKSKCTGNLPTVPGIVFSVITLVTVLTLGGCSGYAEEEKAEQSFFAMDTVMALSAYGAGAEEAVAAAAAEINRLDAMLSTGNEDSEIASLNTGGEAALSEETFGLMKEALAIGGKTGGRFDITIYPVMEAWGFPTQEYRVPSAAQLKKLLRLVDRKKVLLNEADRSVSFAKKGMAVDLGGIAKGYTSGRVAAFFREHGIKSGLVNLGGNVQAIGAKTNGKKWRVAVRDPENPEGYICVVEVEDQAVITSGGYERYFEENGKIYHHIIDPATGYPAETGLASVTIVSTDGMLADALST